MARRLSVLRKFVKPGIRDKIHRRIARFQTSIGYFGSDSPKRDPGDDTRYFIGPFLVRPQDAFIELEIKLQLSWAQTRDYRGSKLYYKVESHLPYSESECIFFWVHRNGESERLRLVLPQSAHASGWIKLRLDALPFTEGRVEVSCCRLVEAGDALEALDRAAVMHAMKLRTDREVAKSIASGRHMLDHYPNQIAMEIQPNCNLTCAHCPTHGKPEIHEQCNKLNEMDHGLLAKFAHEVFPHIDCVSLVGRGEPLYASDELWTALIEHLTQYGVRLTVVTNGTMVRRRITPAILPLIETLSFSIDGGTPETFARNRGGASFYRVMEAVAYFHELRKRACLPRRPKLSVSWTIKKNNVAELPGFLRYISQFEPDKFIFRYMVMCEELEQDQSLLDDPEAANSYLIDAYVYLEKLGAEVVRPPLFERPPKICENEAQNAPDAAVPTETPISEPMRHCLHMFAEGVMLAGGTLMSCCAYFAESVGDLNSEPDYMSVWSGARMQSLRAGFRTEKQWPQCGECWISQMRLHTPDEAQPQRDIYSPAQLTALSRKAWDLRNCARR